jgi:four helix bundle protein
MNYDLEERTAKFGEKVIDFVKKLEKNAVNNVLVGQIVRSATSIGANYCEANNASSKKGFSQQDIYLPKRSRRNETLGSYDSKSK